MGQRTYAFCCPVRLVFLLPRCTGQVPGPRRRRHPANRAQVMMRHNATSQHDQVAHAPATPRLLSCGRLNFFVFFFFFWVGMQLIKEKMEAQRSAGAELATRSRWFTIYESRESEFRAGVVLQAGCFTACSTLRAPCPSLCQVGRLVVEAVCTWHPPPCLSRRVSFMVQPALHFFLQ